MTARQQANRQHDHSQPEQAALDQPQKPNALGRRTFMKTLAITGGSLVPMGVSWADQNDGGAGNDQGDNNQGNQRMTDGPPSPLLRT